MRLGGRQAWIFILTFAGVNVLTYPASGLEATGVVTCGGGLAGDGTYGHRGWIGQTVRGIATVDELTLGFGAAFSFGSVPTAIDGDGVVPPYRRTLLIVRPNPFNPRTVIEYGLPAAGHVRLSVYDLVGRRVAVLIDGFRLSGRGEVSWDGRDDDGRNVPSGIYLLHLNVNGADALARMTLLR